MVNLPKMSRSDPLQYQSNNDRISTPTVQTIFNDTDAIDIQQIDRELKRLPILQGTVQNNRYVVSSNGNRILQVTENTPYEERIARGTSRPFHVSVTTPDGTQVMVLDRRYAMRFFCCPCACCMEYLTVRTNAVDNTLIGKVIEEFSFCRKQFRIDDATGTTLLRVTTPFFLEYTCKGPYIFKVFDPQKVEQCGTITFTNDQQFHVDFTTEMQSSTKALLLAMVILLDFIYFEEDKIW